MSPEQVLGRAVDARSDIFSVGCTLYEVLTGERAFPGDSASSVMYKIVHESPARPARLRPDTDPGLEAVALKALANNPEDRYDDCLEMAAALRACVDRRTKVPNADPDPLEPQRLSTKSKTKETGAKRISARLTLVVAGATIAAIAAVVLVQHADRKTPQPKALSAQIPSSTTSPPEVPATQGILNSPPRADRAEKHLQSGTSSGGHRPPFIYTRPTQRLPPPDDFTTTLLRGDAAFAQSDYEGALSAYLRADAVKPSDPGVRRKLSVTLTLLGRAAEAQMYR
jgi:serine/threonine protein kinase